MEAVLRVCIVLPGHSVARDKNGVIRSCGLFQEIQYPTPGKEFPFQRSGAELMASESEAKTAYLAGQWQVVRAGASCYHMLHGLEHETSFLLPAGRPDYMDQISQDRTLSEGDIMARELRNELRDEGDISIEIHGANRVTKDDGLSTLNAATSGDFDHVLVIMMTFRIARFELLLQEICRDHPELKKGLESIRVMAAEAFNTNVEVFLHMSISDAYRRTVRNERFGIEKALETGTAATTGGRT